MPIDNINNLLTGKPGLFSPQLVRSIKEPGQNSVYYSLATINPDLTTDVTESFTYTSPGTGLRSTQQLNVDWSKFENHTFFNSAQVKLNVTFDKIQNGFPFDGSQKETQTFLDTLTGFEKYVYDSYPKNVGYLFCVGKNEPIVGLLTPFILPNNTVAVERTAPVLPAETKAFT